MLAHLELVLELKPAGLQLAEHDRERHQLTHAGRRHERVGILLEQNEIGVGVHEKGVLRLGLERAGRRGGVTRGDSGTRRADQEDGGRGRELDPSIKTRGVHGVTTQNRVGYAGGHGLPIPQPISSDLGKKATREPRRPNFSR